MSAGLLPLACPYCGDEITAELTYTAHYSEHRELTGYECDNWECGASWDKRGRPLDASKIASQAAGDIAERESSE